MKRMKQIRKPITSGSSILPLGLTSGGEGCFDTAWDVCAAGMLGGPCVFGAIEEFHGYKIRIENCMNNYGRDIT